MYNENFNKLLDTIIYLGGLVGWSTNILLRVLYFLMNTE